LDGKESFMNWLGGIFIRFLPGYKTYIAGLGLIGLGAYEISQGSMDQGLAHIGQGLGMIGLKAAIAQNAAAIANK
jgi:hypothetical protein